MSEEESKDYICNNMTDEQEDHKYFIMIYKLNIDKKEKQKIIEKLIIFKKCHLNKTLNILD